MPEPEALKGFQVGISRFLDFSSLVNNTTHHDHRVSYLQAQLKRTLRQRRSAYYTDLV